MTQIKPDVKTLKGSHTATPTNSTTQNITPSHFRCPCCLHWHPIGTAKTVQPWLVNNSRAIVFCVPCFTAFEQLTETDSMILNLHSYLDGAR